MFERVSVLDIARNLAIYTAGVALSVVGALGLVEAVTIAPVISGLLLVVGLVLVVAVHEYLGGPV